MKIWQVLPNYENGLKLRLGEKKIFFSIIWHVLLHILSFTMGYEWNKKSQLFSMFVHILIKLACKSPSLALITVLLKLIKIWYVYLYSNKGMTLSNFPIILFYVSDFCDWLCYLWHLLFDLSKQCKFPSHLRLHI